MKVSTNVIVLYNTACALQNFKAIKLGGLRMSIPFPTGKSRRIYVWDYVRWLDIKHVYILSCLQLKYESQTYKEILDFPLTMSQRSSG